MLVVSQKHWIGGGDEVVDGRRFDYEVVQVETWHLTGLRSYDDLAVHAEDGRGRTSVVQEAGSPLTGMPCEEHMSGPYTVWVGQAPRAP